MKQNLTKNPSVKILKMGDLPIQVTYKSIKNMYMRVKSAAAPDDQTNNYIIMISAPKRTSEQKILHFINTHKSWLSKQKIKIASQNAPQNIHFNYEDKLLFERQLKVLAAKWEERMGVKPRRYVIKNMNSRWGSYSKRTDTICLNIRLSVQPIILQEYVLVHELCHIKVQNHGPKFQAQMDQFLASWKQYRRQLNHR